MRIRIVNRQSTPIGWSGGQSDNIFNEIIEDIGVRTVMPPSAARLHRAEVIRPLAFKPARQPIAS